VLFALALLSNFILFSSLSNAKIEPSGSASVRAGHNRNIDNAPPAPDGSPTEAWDINPALELKAMVGEKRKQTFTLIGRGEYQKYLKSTTSDTAHNLAYNISPVYRQWWLESFTTTFAPKFTRNISGEGLGGATTNSSILFRLNNVYKIDQSLNFGQTLKYKKVFYSFSTKRNEQYSFNLDLSNQFTPIVNAGVDVGFEFVKSTSRSSRARGPSASAMLIYIPYDELSLFSLVNVTRRNYYILDLNDTTLLLLINAEYALLPNLALSLELSHVRSWSKSVSRRFISYIPMVGLEYRF